MEESILANVKNATVVIGLMEPKSDIPHEIIGSGFIFNPNGYVATAGHVADLAYKKYEEWNAKTNLCT